jgi:hypothetical protein
VIVLSNKTNKEKRLVGRQAHDTDRSGLKKTYGMVFGLP